jgi:hypothetical protein
LKEMKQTEYKTKEAMLVYATQEVERAWNRERNPGCSLPPARLQKVVLSGPYTMVMVSGTGPMYATGVGFAKRTPTDTESPTIGISAATFRAVRDYLGLGEYDSTTMSVS